MKKLAILLTKAPYGEINAAEAVRHALGAAAEELEVSLVLADRGVLLGRRGQDEGNTGFTNLGEALSDCLDMDIGVYAEKDSLERANLGAGDLIERIMVVGTKEVSELIGRADQTIIY